MKGRKMIRKSKLAFWPSKKRRFYDRKMLQKATWWLLCLPAVFALSFENTDFPYSLS